MMEEEGLEYEERAALVGELGRVMEMVRSILLEEEEEASAAGEGSVAGNADDVPSLESDRRRRSLLPWADSAPATCPSSSAGGSSSSSSSTPDRRERLRSLAPLLDRLGRTLTDAAPHVAALEEILPRPPPTPEEGDDDREGEEGQSAGGADEEAEEKKAAADKLENGGEDGDGGEDDAFGDGAGHRGG